MRRLVKLLILSAIILHDINVVIGEEGPAEENDPADDDAPVADEGPLKCYECAVTDEQCSVKQDEDNGTLATCETGHCWIWKYEENDEVTYRRDCGGNCTEETRELDCRKSNNKTECSRCCSDSSCNYGLLNGSPNLSMSFHASFGFLLINSYLAWIID